MRFRNCLKTLIGVGVLLLTSCDSKEASKPIHVYYEIEKGEKISFNKFKEIANSLKNNYSDYSKTTETYVLEKVDKRGEKAIQMLDDATQGLSKYGLENFEVGETKTTSYSSNATNTVSTIANALQDASLTSYYSYYNNNGRLSMLNSDDYTSNNIRYYSDICCYFDSNGLAERMDYSFGVVCSEDDRYEFLLAVYIDWSK